jgi:hypothetical protein
MELPDEGVSLEDVEKNLLVAALQKHTWNQARAAAYLRITRSTLMYRMQKFGIERPGWTEPGATILERRPASANWKTPWVPAGDSSQTSRRAAPGWTRRDEREYWACLSASSAAGRDAPPANDVANHWARTPGGTRRSHENRHVRAGWDAAGGGAGSRPCPSQSQ